jgi:hypothetical protein
MTITFAEIAQLITAAAAILAVVQSMRNGKKIEDVHISIDGRMDQLLEVSKKVAHSAGVDDERSREK